VKHVPPDFIATITLYAPDKGGRASPIAGSWFGCACKLDPEDEVAWDCRILTGGARFAPGEIKQFGIKFLTPEAAVRFSKVDKFYLWELRVIGEAAPTKIAAGG